MNLARETQEQIEIGYRYFEGAASGAVMIGQQHLDLDPARLAAIGRRNAAEALLRHDWVYRWEEIFRGLVARERQLKGLTELASPVSSSSPCPQQEKGMSFS